MKTRCRMRDDGGGIGEDVEGRGSKGGRNTPICDFKSAPCSSLPPCSVPCSPLPSNPEIHSNNYLWYVSWLGLFVIGFPPSLLHATLLRLWSTCLICGHALCCVNEENKKSGVSMVRTHRRTWYDCAEVMSYTLPGLPKKRKAVGVQWAW